MNQLSPYDSHLNSVYQEKNFSFQSLIFLNYGASYFSKYALSLSLAFMIVDYQSNQLHPKASSSLEKRIRIEQSTKKPFFSLQELLQKQRTLH